MLTSSPLNLSNSEFTSSAHLRVGLLAGPANAPALRCDCRSTVLPGDSDHHLTCTCLAQQRTSRHDFVRGSWRHIAARAGVPTTAEPPFRSLPSDPGPGGSSCLSSCIGLVVGGVFVPPKAASSFSFFWGGAFPPPPKAAASFAEGAARTSGFAAAARTPQSGADG
jgi:hypothetical protein